MQVAGPLQFAERYITLAELDQAAQHQLMIATRLLCKYMAHKADLYLG